MTPSPSAAFTTVRRGYDPDQVDAKIAELQSAVQSCRGKNAGLERKIEALEEQTHQLQTGALPLSYAGLGERIEKVLVLVDEEAQDLRSRALDDANSALERAENESEQVRAEADRYAHERRSEADAQAGRLLEEARRAADQLRDEAERDTRTYREEAEALFERNRAKVAQAAADFETTLSQRRDQAQRDFTQQINANQERLAAMEQRAEGLRVESEKQRADADRKATQLLEDAQRRADELVAQARAAAERIRIDSERELAAASQRRDSINAQLANVRQMLATLTGATLPNPAENDDAHDTSLVSDAVVEAPGNGANPPESPKPDVVDLRDGAGRAAPDPGPPAKTVTVDVNPAKKASSSKSSR